MNAIPADLTTRERCQMCNHFSPVGFSVPNEVWAASVHPHWANSPLCIMCFARGADERGVAWDQDIEFHPVSFATHTRGKAAGVESVRVDGRPSKRRVLPEEGK